jgi:hypothetical protein
MLANQGRPTVRMLLPGPCVMMRQPFEATLDEASHEFPAGRSVPFFARLERSQRDVRALVRRPGGTGAGHARELERSSLAVRLSAIIGRKVSAIGSIIPANMSEIANKAAEAALRSGLNFSLRSLAGKPLRDRRRMHKSLAVLAGAAGGAFGFSSSRLCDRPWGSGFFQASRMLDFLVLRRRDRSRAVQRQPRPIA